jgi:hypothetical protein
MKARAIRSLLASTAILLAVLLALTTPDDARGAGVDVPRLCVD